MTVQSPSEPARRIRIAIIGGGLAGLSSAHSLATAFETKPDDRNVSAQGAEDHWAAEILLLETRRTTGGRAGSFVDPQTGECVDYCQHVAMGCCTNLIDMMDQCGLSD